MNSKESIPKLSFIDSMHKVFEEKGCSELAKQITLANKDRWAGKYSMDRRKLAKVFGYYGYGGKVGGDFSLGIKDLLAIDIFLRSIGEPSLSEKPLFCEHTLISGFRESRDLKILFGSRQSKAINTVSSWDTRAIAEIVLSIGREGISPERGPEINILEVPKSSKSATIDGSLLKDDDSILCVGSPEASIATEIMLSKMFETTPFKGGSAPFELVRPNKVNSSFYTTKLKYKKTPEGGFRAIQLTEQKRDWVSEPSTGEYIDYGIGIMQYRTEKGLWGVALGTSGPSTFGIAKMFSNLRATIPRRKRVGPYPEPFWFIAEIPVKRTPESIGDDRETGEPTILYRHPSREYVDARGVNIHPARSD